MPDASPKSPASKGNTFHLAVIGGGPAGLRAAEVAASAGIKVTLFDAKPSVGRKFLVAGRGGLNITHEEPSETFVERYRETGEPAAVQSGETRRRWESLLSGFDPAMLRTWATSLGIETFAAGTGRVYPKEMKSAPLLRRWVARLRALNVEFRMHHRWMGLRHADRLELDFAHGSDTPQVRADAVVLALGGKSWPATGSTGDWVHLVENMGIAVAPLQPANCGWECEWPPAVLAACEGMPLKNVSASAGMNRRRGELLVTRYGLEGGALYALSGALRQMEKPLLTVDFKPGSSVESLVARLGSARRNFLEEGQLRWRLGDAAYGLLSGLRDGRPFQSATETAEFVKACPIGLTRPRPVDEAISSAGGVRFEALDEWLMVRALPNVFVAGEMLDWEAPTGGYLMQGCFATGSRAAEGVVRLRG